jgi:putative DNA primase/helicase
VTATAWSRVTKASPCPACGHDSWCTVSPGGTLARCKRETSREPVHGDDGDAWMHRFDGGAPADKAPHVSKGPSIDSIWRARADSFAAAITPAQLDTLARQLGVTATILRDLGVGWDRAAWTFPMFGADGAVCGVRRRPLKGKKHCIKGSKLGVFRRLKPEDGLLLITEGESDAAAAMTLGFDAIGVPGAGQCSDVAAAYACGRAVVIVADGDEAGVRGAEKLAAVTSTVAASVCVLQPPSGHKDMRAWVNAGATRADVDEAIAGSSTLTRPTEDRPPWRRGSRVRQCQDLLPLGSRDPESTKLVLSTAKTLPTAQAYVRENEWHEGIATLHHYAGSFMQWRGNRWADVEEGALAKHLHQLLHDDAVQYVLDKKTGAYVLVNFNANPSTVRQAIDTLRNHCFLPSSTAVPSWFGGAPPFPLRELMACATRTLHIPTGQTIAPTPAFFTTAALEFDYDPGAPEPLRWLTFLRELFGNDDEQVRLLQEWFGYALTADTSQQKILLVVGPRRSGKGTLARVLTHLVGAANVVGPTVSSLGGPFGLQPLLGKSLAIVSDARFAGENVLTVVERLLCISGEDTITVDRKHVASVTLRLPTRFVFLTNELPRLSDASTALAGRFSILRLDRSFYGNEDVGLLDALLGELPGILLWSILGWHRLHEQRRFTDPVSTRTAVQDIEDLSSPVAAFVRDRCTVGPAQTVLCGDLYGAWTSWCATEGRSMPSTQQVFGRDLAAAVPSVRRRRSTGGKCPRYEGIGLSGVTQ